MAFTIPENEKTITIKLKKRELNDLAKACTMIQFNNEFSDEVRNTYRFLHHKIREQVTKWEEKQ